MTANPTRAELVAAHALLHRPSKVWLLFCEDTDDLRFDIETVLGGKCYLRPRNPDEPTLTILYVHEDVLAIAKMWFADDPYSGGDMFPDEPINLWALSELLAEDVILPAAFDPDEVLGERADEADLILDGKRLGQVTA